MITFLPPLAEVTLNTGCKQYDSSQYDNCLGSYILLLSLAFYVSSEKKQPTISTSYSCCRWWYKLDGRAGRAQNMYYEREELPFRCRSVVGQLWFDLFLFYSSSHIHQKMVLTILAIIIWYLRLWCCATGRIRETANELWQSGGWPPRLDVH